MSLNDTVKKITKHYLESLNLADAVNGVVIQTNPLEVNVEQRLSLDEDFLLVPEHLTEYKVLIGAEEVTIRRGLEAGDRVILLRQQGGLNFVIVGRLTS